MSYLDLPRLSFAGSFTANPSTINNSTENFSLSEVYNNNSPGPLNPNSVSWNPTGWAFFTIPSGTINSGCIQLGTRITSGDPLIGGQVVSVPTGAGPGHQGRLVDLDPDQQARSMIVGMRLQISTTDGASMAGTVVPMTIIDLWGRVQGGNGGGINTAGCMYQSILVDLTWTGVEQTSSKIFRALYAASPEALSIKFNVDKYNGLGPSDPEFTTGRFVGTIGPYRELASGVPEPMHVLAQRRMWNLSGVVVPQYYNPAPPVKNPSPLNSAPFQVTSDGWLSVDLGNSIPTVPSVSEPRLAGAFAELGPVSLVIVVPNQAPVMVGTLFATGSEFETYYETRAGIFDVRLTARQLSALEKAPLAIQIGPPPRDSPTLSGAVPTPQQARLAKEGLYVEFDAAPPVSAAPKLALAENPDGTFASLDFNALRLAKGAPPWQSTPLLGQNITAKRLPMSGAEITSNAEVPLYATVFGKPATNQTLNVQTAINTYQFDTNQGTPNFISNAPASAINPAPQWIDPPPTGYTPPNIATITTDANGVGILSVSANDLSQQDIDSVQGNRRQLPSQVYLYDHDWSMDTIGQPITFLVFINTPGLANPTWTNDVYPIFLQYARLYPGMKGILDLSDEATVAQNYKRFKAVMNLPMCDPGMMPVTRDLAPVQLAMINAWFVSMASGESR